MTKQAARRSTGGKAPRKDLQIKAARQSGSDPRGHLMDELSSRTDIYKVEKSSATSITYNHHIWVMRGKMRYDVTESELRQLLGYHITDFLTRIPVADLSLDDMMRLGLTESVNDSSRYRTFAGEERNIETIYFDDDTGLYCGVHEETKRPHVTLLYSLKITGSGDSTEHVTKDNEFHFGGRDRILAYHDHPGRRLNMDFSRAREVNSLAHYFVLLTAPPVQYRDKSDSCMQAALCNALDILGYPGMAVNVWICFRQLEMALTETVLPLYVSVTSETSASMWILEGLFYTPFTPCSRRSHFFWVASPAFT